MANLKVEDTFYSNFHFKDQLLKTLKTLKMAPTNSKNLKYSARYWFSTFYPKTPESVNFLPSKWCGPVKWQHKK